jgi:hypothetical protein
MTAAAGRPAVAGSLRKMLVPLALAQFICSFAGSNMNVMINDIKDDLHTTVQGVQVCVTLFLLVMAALMIPCGKLTDRWGRKRRFTTGLVVYGIGADGGIDCESTARRRPAVRREPRSAAIAGRGYGHRHNAERHDGGGHRSPRSRHVPGQSPRHLGSMCCLSAAEHRGAARWRWCRARGKRACKRLSARYTPSSSALLNVSPSSTG